MNEYLPALLGLGSPAVALISVWIGSRLTGGREHGNWLRGEKFKVYVELIEFIHQFNYALKDEKLFNTFANGFNPLRARADLVASQKVRDLMKNIVAQAYKSDSKTRLERQRIEKEHDAKQVEALLHFDLEVRRDELIAALTTLQNKLREDLEPRRRGLPRKRSSG